MSSNKIDGVEPIDAFESTIYDLIVYVLDYNPGLDAIVNMDPDDSFPPEPEEIDYAMYDMDGNRVYDEDIEENDDYPDWFDVDSDIENEIRNRFDTSYEDDSII